MTKKFSVIYEVYILRDSVSLHKSKISPFQYKALARAWRNADLPIPQEVTILSNMVGDRLSEISLGAFRVAAASTLDGSFLSIGRDEDVMRWRAVMKDQKNYPTSLLLAKSLERKTPESAQKLFKKTDKIYQLCSYH